MWNFLTDSGSATVTLDFANNLSGLLLGLIGVVWFSTGILACVTICHYVSQGTTLRAETAPTPASHREAA